MGRHRATRSNLPPYVYRKKTINRVEYRPYIGKGKYEKSIYLRDENGTPLLANASDHEITKAYHLVVNLQAKKGKTIDWLFTQYFKSMEFKQLSERSQLDNKRYADFLSSITSKNGALLGEFPFKKLTKATVIKIRDKYIETPTQTKHKLAFLRKVYNWAIKYDYMKDNPADIFLPKTQSRTRYIEDWEYKLVYDNAPAYVQAGMELAYLCRARRDEVLSYTRDDLTPDGLYLNRSKKSHSEITQYSERLENAVKQAKSHNSSVLSNYLLHDKQGNKMKGDNFYRAFKTAQKKAMKQGLRETFTFHDIKAKGVTDHSGNYSGHKTKEAHNIYLRKATKREATK